MPKLLVIEFVKDFIHEDELQKLFELYFHPEKINYLFKFGRELSVSVGGLDEEARIELAMGVSGYILNNFESKISLEFKP